MSFGNTHSSPSPAIASQASSPIPNLFSSQSGSGILGSSTQPTTSSPTIRRGTRGAPGAPYLVELSGYSQSDHFQSITTHALYSAFSAEEHRLEDYKHRGGGEKAQGAAKIPFSGFPQPAVKSTDPMTAIAARRDGLQLLRLRGAVIEIRVGTAVCSCAETAACLCDNIWNLPKGLISHYSPFLKAACERNFQEKQESLIVLPEDDPTVFGLFVEWMYYGSCTIPRPLPSPPDLNLDAKCWILGDKLLSVDFKNEALRRIYQGHHGFFTSRTVSVDGMQYVLENTGPKSSLRLFYIDYMIAHWAEPERLKGTSQDWDELLQDHADARIALLESFRNISKVQPVMKKEKHYLETDETVHKAVEKITIEE